MNTTVGVIIFCVLIVTTQIHHEHKQRKEIRKYFAGFSNKISTNVFNSDEFIKEIK
jgi:hypothetical protein